MEKTHVFDLDNGFKVSLGIDYDDETGYPSINGAEVLPSYEDFRRAQQPTPQTVYKLTLESGEVVELSVDELTPAGVPHDHNVVGVMWANAKGGPSRVVKQEPAAPSILPQEETA